MNFVSQHEFFHHCLSLGAAKELVGVLPTDLEGKLPRTHEIHMHHWRKLQRLCDKERFCVDECVNELYTRSGGWRKFHPLYWGIGKVRQNLGWWDKNW